MKLGFMGLGKMGSRMVIKLLRDGHEVVVWNRSKEAVENLKSLIINHKYNEQNLEIASSIEVLVKQLQQPRIVWLMVPAGEVTESLLSEVSQCIEKGDIVIDGGNAFYKDTERRSSKLKAQGITYLGVGVSGGLIAFEEGYPLMVGGDKSAYDYVRPILDSLVKPKGGHEYFGVGGAGHFVKMVHNGIEYGIMQSLGEGFGVLDKAPYEFNLQKVAKLYQKNSLVSGFMLDRAVDALENDPKLENIVGVIAESGEAKWTVEQAKEENVPVEIIEQSLEFRRKSQTDKEVQKSFAARMVAALRNAFGGHEVKQAKV